MIVLAATLACGRRTTAPTPTPGVEHRLDHVVVIVMENHDYDTVRVYPYASALIASGTLLANSWALQHPSQPNYLALWSGARQGVTGDQCPAPGVPFMTENLGHACQAAGLTWRAYCGGLTPPGTDDCSTGSSPYSYTRTHAPWTDFGNLDHMNEQPYTEMAADIAAGRLPDLAFVIPDVCDDGHNCGAMIADQWLAANVPAMIRAVGSHGMVILTWDENGGRGHPNHILTVLAGGAVKAGYVSNQRVDHHTVLRMICESLHLAPFAAARDSAASITDVWR